MNREQCKSVNINDVKVKNGILKDENKSEKSVKCLKKVKKTKIKDCLLNKKQNDNKDKLKKTILKKKSFFCREQSKSYIEESKKANIQKIQKKARGTNHSGGDIKTKSYYYSNKYINQNYNNNFFKKKIQEKNNEKGRQNSIVGNTERKKKKKGNKTPLGEINNNIKSIKLKFPKPINLKINDNKKQSLNLIKDHIKLKKIKDDSSDDSSITKNNKDKLKYSKTKKLKIKKIYSKVYDKKKNHSHSEENNEEKTKTPNRRISGFSFKKKLKRRNTDNDHSEPNTFKTIKLKNSKDNNSKNHYSINKLNNSTQKKDDESYKNTLDDKERINKMTNILRRKRSISLTLEKSQIKEIAETIKHKKTMNPPILNNSLSTTNLHKLKKVKKKKIDFERALKKNSRKMQFN